MRVPTYNIDRLNIYKLNNIAQHLFFFFFNPVVVQRFIHYSKTNL